MGKYACHVAVGVVLTALVLQTWGVLGVVTPVRVSAGSMAGAYLGPHREAMCGACGAAVVCGVEQLPSDGEAQCLNCGAWGVDLSGVADRPGEQVWIDRATFEFRPPRRWEPVVFRWPDEAQHLFLKRVVGLPGESIAIRDGDVYVDGRIARKSWEAARRMAQTVHDDVFTTTPPAAKAPHWRPRAADSTWIRSAGGAWSCCGTRKSSERFKNGERSEFSRIPPRVDWLDFHPLRGRPITDDSAYNQSETRRLQDVHDVGFACDVQLSGGGNLRLRLVDGQDQFELVLRPAEGRAELWRQGTKVSTAALAADALAAPCRLEAGLVDEQVWLSIAGRVVLQAPYDPTPPRTAPARPLAVGAEGGVVELWGLRVWRDVHYLEPAAVGGRMGRGLPARLGDEEFFVLGDNSPISLDSRVLPGGGLARKLIVGKPLPAR